MLPPIPESWREALGAEVNKPYYKALDAFLDEEIAAGKTILPRSEDIFNALSLTPLENVKVLLLGQDPYPNPGDAHGLCFSVQPQVRPIPGSLRNVYKEMQDDLGHNIPNNGFLESWAKQGVLMLNTVLTVPAHQANEHRNKGWETFTDRVIELVAAKPPRVVFMFWGKSAQKKSKLVRQPHHVINCAHPSQLSAKMFFGCRCFSKTNQSLAEVGLGPIDWKISEV